MRTTTTSTSAALACACSMIETGAYVEQVNSPFYR